jgi:hypothetical protein
MMFLIDGSCLLVHAIAATEPGAQPPDQAAECGPKRRAAVLDEAGGLGEEGAQVMFPGTPAAGLKEDDVTAAFSDQGAVQPAALAGTMERETGRQGQQLFAAGVNR